MLDHSKYDAIKWKGFVLANKAVNISITGKGAIDGNGSKLGTKMDSLFYVGQIDSTDYLIHPIGDFRIEDNRGKVIYKSSGYGSKDFSISSYGGYRISGNLSNVKFQHIDSEKLSVLTTNVIKIKSLTFLRKVYDNSKKQFLVYEVTDKDTNQDGKLDYNDINTLFISKINGTDFRKLTETNKELIDWKLIESKNRLYFRTIEDTNKDGEFDKKDIVHYKYVDLNSDNLKITEYKPI